MRFLTRPTNAPGVSLKYVTIGAVLAVLSGTSYYFLPRTSDHAFLEYCRMCALILGVVLLVIGFAVGRIGQVSGESQPVPVTNPVEVPVVTPVDPTVPVVAVHPQVVNGAAVLTTADTAHGA